MLVACNNAGRLNFCANTRVQSIIYRRVTPQYAESVLPEVFKAAEIAFKGWSKAPITGAQILRRYAEVGHARLFAHQKPC
jgi:hypothetical protein